VNPGENWQAIEAVRKKLLETSRRNRLINYRPSRASGAEIEGESADFVYQRLVTEGKRMELKGRPDQAKRPDGVLEPELPQLGEPVWQAADPSDRFLNCTDTEHRLGRKLLKTMRDQRVLIEETGVNALFLALGALIWKEPGSKEQERRSPLILIPVNLVRRGSTDRFELEWDGTEPIHNLSVQALFKDEFRIQLPDLSLGEEMSPSGYFKSSAEAIEQKPWKIEPGAIALGFFSSAKHLMFEDLDASRWPEEGGPQAHPLLATIMDPNAESLLPVRALPFGEDQLIDPHRPIAQSHEVVDCDGSQLIAIMQAATGSSMVIEGPPGTGKSQTITNLLADAVARGKRVLFVAEKSAALNVVARNLERVGLRHLCLELHSHHANKAEFYRNLAKCLERASHEPTNADIQAELARVRDKLNQYSESVNRAIRETGCTPRDAMGELLSLGDDLTDRTRVGEAELSSLTRSALPALIELLEPAQAWSRNFGHPGDHPFAPLVPSLDPVAQGQFLDALKGLIKILSELEAASQTVCQELSLEHPIGLCEVGRLVNALSAITKMPSLDGVVVNMAVMQERGDSILEALQMCCSWATMKMGVGSGLTDHQWLEIAAIETGDLRLFKAGFGRFLNVKYHKLKALADSCGEKLDTDEARYVRLSDLVECAAKEKQIESQMSAIQLAIPSASLNPGLPWSNWASAWGWLASSRQGILDSTLPSDFLGQAPTMKADRAEALRIELEVSLQAFESQAAICASLGWAPSGDLKAIRSQAVSMFEQANGLDPWCKWVAMSDRIKEANQGPLLETALVNRRSDRLVEILKRSFYERIVQSAYLDPVIRDFSLEGQEALVKRFRALDEELLVFNRKKIVAVHARRLPSGLGGSGAVGKIQREAQKQRRHVSIRKTMEEAYPVIQDIKPIFMMSPVSIAMYLPQSGPRFDVIIFDEASQVRPEEAMGAIARGAQVIVVGDTKQMPPTSFFERMTSDDGSEEEVEDATVGLESILDLVSTRLPLGSSGRRDLRWHYRSRHSSLITPSNGLFYDWRLYIVPNPVPPNQALGLIYRHLPEAVYERGRSRTNPEEAKQVAMAMVRHLRERPQESLMAVAFSQVQQQAVQDEFDRQVREVPELLTHYEAIHPTEPVDIKNLESVQGDERDVVLISVGYGRTAEGNVPQSFGPLNLEGGWRRLNVLITRARYRCEVFTNLFPEDIRAEGRGPTALRKFLSYAQSGHMELPQVTGREPMSVFEEQVIDALSKEGFTCEPQVGVAGFFIDIGVRHPEFPERFCIGIECDGAQYHSSVTARDRDRLRQSVLESRGWKIARVWSTDWFADRNAAEHRLIQQVRDSIQAPDRRLPTVEVEAPPSEMKLSVQEDCSPQRKSIPPIRLQPYKMAKVTPLVYWDSDYMSDSEVVPRMKSVIVEEAPIHFDEVVRRIREASGGGRTGHKIQSIFTRCASLAVPDGFVYKDSWYLPSTSVPPRDRINADAPLRKIQYIHDDEIIAAMAKVLKAERVIQGDGLVREAFRLLGVARVSKDAQARGQAILLDALERGWVIQLPGGWALPR